MMNAPRRLYLQPLASGTALAIYALERDGRCEVIEALRSLGEESYSQYSSTRNMILHIAEHGFHSPQSWYRRIRGWRDQWEIRKGDHRFLGFVDGDSLVLCIHRRKRRQKLAEEDFARVDSLRKEWLHESRTRP